MYLWTVLAYSSPILHKAHLKWRDDPVRLSNMVTTRKVFAAAAGTVLLLLNFSSVYADNSSTGTVSTDTASLRIFEIDMNDQNPLATLKQKVIEERAGYDAAVNLNNINMDASSIYTDTFDRTKPGIQKVNISVSLVRSSDSTVGYDFTEYAAVKMVSPNGPQVILKQPSITLDLGTAFNYGDNIGYVSSTGGKLPAIKETDNVDINTEGTYTCTMTFYDTSGNSSEVSYDVTVKKPVEVVRAEEEAAAQEAAKQAADEAARKAQEEAEAQAAAAAQLQAQQAASLISSSSATVNTGSGNSIVEFATSLIGSRYVWGGTSPATGFDCSGFTQYVYSQFGISLPRTSYGQENSGTLVSAADAQPGDLVTWNGHSAIYVGNGMVVNAMDPSNGVKECSMYAISNGNMQIHRVS